MYLLYLDDSGSASNKNEAYLVLGGFSVFERQVHWVSQEMEKLAAAIYSANPAAVEFHASEVFSGRTPPWNSIKKDDRRMIIKKILEIAAHSNITLFACAVKKEAVLGSDPMELAFEELCDRFDKQLKRLYKVEHNPQRGLIIVDENTKYETSLQRLSHDFRSLGTRWGIIHNIADVPLFVSSKASRCVQLADHIAYSVFRRYESGDASYLDLIMHKFDCEHDKIHGLIHKTNDWQKCMCQACLSRRLTQSTTTNVT